MRIMIITLALILQAISTSFSQDIVEEYIGAFQYVAVSEMERTGIPASIKLAQGLLESSWGRSELSTEAHNHFGIKCGGSWDGITYQKEDDDYDENGKLKKSCFRVFESDQASYIAHSEFLLTNPRYGFLFDYSETDYKAWAKGLKKAGYASDPSYPSKLIGIIKKYDLARFDYMAADEMYLLAEGGAEETPVSAEQAFLEESLAGDEEEPIMETLASSEETENSDMTSTSKGNEMVEEIQQSAINFWNKQKAKREKAGKKTLNFDQLLAEVRAIGDDILGEEREDERITSTPDIETFNGVKIVIAEHGQTLSDIAQNENVSVENLKQYNEDLFTEDQKLQRGTSIFLEPKLTVFNGTASSHYVQLRETIAEIAQKYGVTAESLRKRNYLKEGEEAKHGEIIYLRGIRLAGKPEIRKAKTSKNSRYLFDNQSQVDRD